MATENLIEATVFCTYHQVEYSFINSLVESGLVHLTVVDKQRFITHDELPQVEKMIRMHQDLDINIAGIEAVVNVLQRLEALQQQNRDLANKLHLYESF